MMSKYKNWITGLIVVIVLGGVIFLRFGGDEEVADVVESEDGEVLAEVIYGGNSVSAEAKEDNGGEIRVGENGGITEKQIDIAENMGLKITKSGEISTDNWRTIESKDEKYSLSVPDSWEIKENSETGTIKLSSLYIPEDAGFMEGYEFWMNVYNEQNTNNQTLDEYYNSTDDSDVIEKEEILVAGERAIVARVGGHGLSYDVFIEHEGDFYYIPIVNTGLPEDITYEILSTIDFNSQG